MRIAIVVAFFDPSLDYFETTAARVLAVDYEVHVITSVRRSPTLADAGLDSGDPFPGGTDSTAGVTVHRLEPRLSLGQRVVAAGVGGRLESIQPDLIIQVVPAQLFSIPASTYATSHGIPLIYVSGENSQQGPQEGIRLLLRRLYMKTLWRAIVRRTAKVATRVIATTEETSRLLEECGVPTPLLMPLPFRSDRFFWSPEARVTTRRLLSLEDRYVTIFVGRFVPEKRIESIIEAWATTASNDPDAHLLLVGCGEDAYSRGVLATAAASASAERITTVPFAEAALVNQYLNAADVGIWPTVSVGIQQAMATGLYVLVPEGSPGEFLLQGPAETLGSSYSHSEIPGVGTSLAQSIAASRSKGGQTDRSKRAHLAAMLYADVDLGNRLLAGLS